MPILTIKNTMVGYTALTNSRQNDHQGVEMTDKKLSSLEKLKEKQKAISAKIQQVEAKTKNIERKKDTRRKILVGLYYLEQAANDGKMPEINKAMEKFLKRNIDRVLFGLTKISEN